MDGQAREKTTPRREIPRIVDSDSKVVVPFIPAWAKQAASQAKKVANSDTVLLTARSNAKALLEARESADEIAQLVRLVCEVKQEMGSRIAELSDDNRQLHDDQERLVRLVLQTQQYADDMERWAESGERLHAGQLAAAEQRTAAAEQRVAAAEQRATMALQISEELLDTRWMRSKRRRAFEGRIDTIRE